MIRPFLAALALSTAISVVPAGAEDAATVVATVNGEAITLGQMIAMKDSLDEQAKAGLDDAALWNLMLDQMVRQTAVAQEGAKAMTPRDTAVLELERRGYLSTAALQRVAEAEPTQEAAAPGVASRRPPAGVLAQHRGRMYSKVVRQRLAGDELAQQRVLAVLVLDRDVRLERLAHALGLVHDVGRVEPGDGDAVPAVRS